MEQETKEVLAGMIKIVSSKKAIKMTNNNATIDPIEMLQIQSVAWSLLYWRMGIRSRDATGKTKQHGARLKDTRKQCDYLGKIELGPGSSGPGTNTKRLLQIQVRKILDSIIDQLRTKYTNIS